MPFHVYANRVVQHRKICYFYATVSESDKWREKNCEAEIWNRNDSLFHNAIGIIREQKIRVLTEYI